MSLIKQILGDENLGKYYTLTPEQATNLKKLRDTYRHKIPSHADIEPIELKNGDFILPIHVFDGDFSEFKKVLGTDYQAKDIYQSDKK